MQSVQTDVVIVGGGGAGLRAAIAVAESDPRLSHRSRLEGRAHAQPHRGRRRRLGRRHPRATTASTATSTTPLAAATGCATRTWSSIFVAHCAEEMMQLEHWGCPWSRKDDGHVNVRFFGGMKVQRTWFASDKTGFHMLHTLFQTSHKYPSIKRYDEYLLRRPDRGGRPCAGRGRDRHRHRGVFADRMQGGDHLHRRRRARLRPEHQRRHRHRRRHGYRLPPWRPPARHGVRPVPSDGASRLRRAHHRRLPRRRRNPHQQGRLSLPPGLRSRPARSVAAPEGDGARPARPAVAGVLARGAERPHGEHAPGAGGAARPAPPGRREDPRAAAAHHRGRQDLHRRGSRRSRRFRCAPRCITRWAAFPATFAPRLR